MNEETKNLDIFAIVPGVVPAAGDIADAGTINGEMGPPTRPELQAGEDAELPGAVAKAARAPARRKKLTTLHLTSYTCRWPIGDPVQADFHYCGELPAPGRNYCATHDAMSMQPATRRRVSS